MWPILRCRRHFFLFSALERYKRAVNGCFECVSECVWGKMSPYFLCENSNHSLEQKLVCASCALHGLALLAASSVLSVATCRGCTQRNMSFRALSLQNLQTCLSLTLEACLWKITVKSIPINLRFRDHMACSYFHSSEAAALKCLITWY